MSSTHHRQEAIQRGARMLRIALGPAIARFLEYVTVVEVMLNPDGRIWIDRLSEGLADTGETISPADGERIVRLVAHHVGAEVHARAPRVSAELPESGERFEGLLPPVVAAPAFAIRKPASIVFSLADYVAAGIMSADQADTLRSAVQSRANILVAGGTSTGKTTLTNALLAEVAKGADRVVIIEDTRELQCSAPNLVAMRTKDGVATLSDLVRSLLRLRPDRIPIGEVRGAEALDLLKAWGTGHPGGIGTIHTGTGIGALRRDEIHPPELVRKGDDFRYFSFNGVAADGARFDTEHLHITAMHEQSDNSGAVMRVEARCQKATLRFKRSEPVALPVLRLRLKGFENFGSHHATCRLGRVALAGEHSVEDRNAVTGYIILEASLTEMGAPTLSCTES